MAELQVMLSDEERKYLVSLLEQTLKDALVEEHRTRTPNSAFPRSVQFNSVDGVACRLTTVWHWPILIASSSLSRCCFP
jgi:hypothetical protein